MGSSQAEGRILDFPSEEESEPDRLTFAGFKADSINLIAIERTLHSYLVEHEDVLITYEGIKGDAYWTAFDRRRETGHLDDIFMIDHDRVIEMSATGELADLSGVPGLSGFNELARGQFTSGSGAVWFVPTCLSAYGFYSNLELLGQAGVTPPKNWTELLSACEALGTENGAPIVANNRASLRSLVLAATLLPVYERDDTDSLVRSFNDDPAALCEVLRPGLERVHELIARGYVDGPEVLVTEQTSDDLELFCSGTRPFMAAGAWASPRVIDGAPDLDYCIAAHPMQEDGPVLVTDVNTCISVNAASPYLEKALAFVSHLCEPDVVWEYCESQSSFSPIEGETRTLSDEHVGACSEALSAGRSVIGSDYRLTLPLDASLRAACNELCGGATVDEAEATLLAGLEGR